MVASHGDITWWHHMVTSHGGITWWHYMVTSQSFSRCAVDSSQMSYSSTQLHAFSSFFSREMFLVSVELGPIDVCLLSIP